MCYFDSPCKMYHLILTQKSAIPNKYIVHSVCFGIHCEIFPPEYHFLLTNEN